MTACHPHRFAGARGHRTSESDRGFPQELSWALAGNDIQGTRRPASVPAASPRLGYLTKTGTRGEGGAHKRYIRR